MTPRIALVQIGHRGDLYMPRCNESLAFYADWPWTHRIIIDDSETRLGGAASIRRAWQQLRELDDPPDYVFHMEEDFLLTAPAPLREMSELIDAWTDVANIVLKRQPATLEGPQGYLTDRFPTRSFGLDRDDPEVCMQVHDRGFWVNPCLYPITIPKMYEWPEHGHESDISRSLRADGWQFAVYGNRSDPPRCWHIGDIRGPHWTW